MSSETKVQDTRKRFGSIARSISWSFWWRRLISWLVFDCIVFVGVILIFHLSQGAMSLNLAAVYTAVKPYLPLGIALLIWEFIDLLAILWDVRRVRRELSPLQELALTAEQAANAQLSNFDKIESLEQALMRASVDSPSVRTGDRDLASIEIALNSLLRQMHEAKIQQMRFVSDASHELRTPLAVIQGYVNMLDRWGKSDEKVLDESVEALKQESEHMQELIEQLLFLARGDSGRNTLVKSRFNLASIVREVWDEFSMIDESHVFECSLTDSDTQDPRFEMEGDLAMIKQSMRIITENATKYSKAGSKVHLNALADQRGVAYIVQDEGIGMDEASLHHIFERFYRAENARSENESGSGLGLSIAKWIVDAHGGSIDVISRKDVGTRFTVRFTAA